jgi:hypothetical protein
MHERNHHSAHDRNFLTSRVTRQHFWLVCERCRGLVGGRDTEYDGVGGVVVVSWTSPRQIP